MCGGLGLAVAVGWGGGSFGLSHWRWSATFQRGLGAGGAIRAPAGFSPLLLLLAMHDGEAALLRPQKAL